MSNVATHVMRSARLGTGLILFAYSASHFINHALGIRSLSAMEEGSTVLLGPWQTYAGLTALYSSFLLHGCLGLLALLRRRHLRMPTSEAFQLATGLAIPLLLIPHAAGIRLGYSIQGMEFGYARLLYQFWVVSPDFALPRQILLLVTIWISRLHRPPIMVANDALVFPRCARACILGNTGPRVGHAGVDQRGPRYS